MKIKAIDFGFRCKFSDLECRMNRASSGIRASGDVLLEANQSLEQALHAIEQMAKCESTTARRSAMINLGKVSVETKGQKDIPFPLESTGLPQRNQVN
jgi:hypothetical protein